MLLALALVLGQALLPASPEGPIYANPASLWTPAFFEFAPANGRGLPYSADLCSQLTAGEKAGNWYCMSSGAMATGSVVQLTTTRGAGTTVSSQTVCPNGPNCGAKTSFFVPSYAGGGDYGWTESANVDRSANSGSWTACWEGQVFFDTAGGERHLMGLASSGGAPWKFMLYVSPTTDSFARLYHSTATCGAGTSSVNSSISVYSGAHHFICGSYSTSDGIFRTYVDGTPGGVSASYLTTCGGGAYSRHSLGSYWNTSALASSTQGHHLGALYVETQLSGARIAELARAVLADTPTGAKGETLTRTRASIRGCDVQGVGQTANAGSMLPPARMCITQGGIGDDVSVANLTPRSEEFDNALWFKEGSTTAPTVTANSGTGPYGTLAPERIQFAATSGAAFSDIYGVMTSPGAADPTTCSFFVRSLTTDGTTDVCLYDGAGAACAACSYSASQWNRCSVSDAVGVVASRWCKLGNNSNQNGGVARSAADLLVFGAMGEASPYATSYVSTTSASVTRATDQVDVDLGPGAPNPTSASLAGTVVGKRVATATGYMGLLNAASDSVGGTSGKGMWLYSAATSGTTMRCIVMDDVGALFATSSVAGSVGTVRGWCSSTTAAGVSGSWAGTSMTPSASLTGSYSPARYLRLAGQSLGSTDAIKRELCFSETNSRCR